MTTILGINPDSDGFGAAIVQDHRIVSAVEQFKIREHWSSRDIAPLPADAIRTSIQAARIAPGDVDIIAFASDVNSAEIIIPHIRRLGLNPAARIEPVDHRIAHSTAVFYMSPFERAAVLILDRGTSTRDIYSAIAEGTHISIEDAPERFSGLGRMYDQVSTALGFHSHASGKVAWLGSTGEPKFLDAFRQLDLKTIPFEKRQDVAASLQAWTNEMVIQLADDVCRRHNVNNICVAGHLAENPFLIQALEEHFGTDRVFVPPAPGNDSISIGAALAQLRRDRLPAPELRFVYPALGPEFSDPEIKTELDNCKLVCSFFPSTGALIETACKTLAEGGLVGWFQGRCEFGHRALGYRSILANPFTPYIDENINRFLKHRESYHPFAISAAEECVPEYFERVGANSRTIASVYAVRESSRTMLSKFAVRERYVRVHTVKAADNSLLWTLLRKMQESTGHALLINTSFNLPSEPLVMTPRDAIRSFYASGLDALAIGRFMVIK